MSVHIFTLVLYEGKIHNLISKILYSKRKRKIWRTKLYKLLRNSLIEANGFIDVIADTRP